MASTNWWLATGARSKKALCPRRSLMALLSTPSECSWSWRMLTSACLHHSKGAHELGHVLNSVCVRDGARPSVVQGQDRECRWSVAVFAPREEKEINLHQESARFSGWTHTKHQLRYGRCTDAASLDSEFEGNVWLVLLSVCAVWECCLARDVQDHGSFKWRNFANERRLRGAAGGVGLQKDVHAPAAVSNAALLSGGTRFWERTQTHHPRSRVLSLCDDGPLHVGN